MSERIVLPLPLLLYGEIFAHNVTDVVVSGAQNDWDQIVAFTTKGVSSRGVTLDPANNHVFIERPGIYEASLLWSGFGPASPHRWDFHVAKNNRATTFVNFTGHMTTPTAQNITTVSADGKVSLDVNDTVELWVQRLSAGGNINLTTTACTLGITRISKR